MQSKATTHAERAKLGVLLEMGSDFFKQTPPNETCSELEMRSDVLQACRTASQGRGNSQATAKELSLTTINLDAKHTTIP